MIYVIARMELNDNCMDAMQQLLSRTVPQVLAEEGCLQYTPCVDVDEATQAQYITIVEAWSSRETHKAHLATAHMAEFREAAKSLRKGSDVKIVAPLN